eukprot:TRINITY_DN10109_c0_g2_i4.p1 TRINITY_DN10109_c0_g2~~TRINITY_DN10109_c0_g2_i4.p1  ORF type:complete len:386 (+),score=60.34 TRINITY_DN10109_c0_g2_i4:97-1254(+)
MGEKKIMGNDSTKEALSKPGFQNAIISSRLIRPQSRPFLDQVEKRIFPDGRPKQNYTFSRAGTLDQLLLEAFKCSSEATMGLLLFLIDDFEALTSVSSAFYYIFHQLLEQRLAIVDQKFKACLHQYFELKAGYTTLWRIRRKRNERVLRAERNLIAFLKPRFKDKTLVLGYKYHAQDGERVGYFKFDAISSKNKTIWLFKDDTSNNYDRKKEAHSQPVAAISVGDNFKLAITFPRLKDIIGVAGFSFLTLSVLDEVITEPEFYENVRNFDASRHCELEEHDDKWVTQNTIESTKRINFDVFKPQFTLVDSLYSYRGTNVYKTLFKATSPGLVYNSMSKLGLDLIVARADEELTNEVKRMGCYDAAEKVVHLRVGDRLIFYHACDS